MISIHGNIKNIHEATICKVTYPSQNKVLSKNEFLCISDLSNIPNSTLAGIITSSKQVYNEITFCPTLQILTKDISLLEGDVLLIYPSGDVIKLYDAGSKTNTLFLTEECNCRCITCPQPPKKKDDEDHINIALKSIELMSEATQCLGISGGEPTVKWDGLLKIIKKCREYLPDTSLQLLTNARVLKDYNKAKALSDSGGDNLFAGVPIYSDIDQIHDFHSGIKGSFWDTLEGIYNLERAGVSIELRIVITKTNYKRLPQLANFIYMTMPFVGCVVFMGLEIIGEAEKNIDKLWVSPIEYAEKLEQSLKILRQRGIEAAIFNHQLCTLPKALWPIAKSAISEWKVRYLPKCNVCKEKENCGGFFFSTEQYVGNLISPITD